MCCAAEAGLCLRTVRAMHESRVTAKRNQEVWRTSEWAMQLEDGDDDDDGGNKNSDRTGRGLACCLEEDIERRHICRH